jgi:hypothetical protein
MQPYILAIAPTLVALSSSSTPRSCYVYVKHELIIRRSDNTVRSTGTVAQPLWGWAARNSMTYVPFPTAITQRARLLTLANGDYAAGDRIESNFYFRSERTNTGDRFKADYYGMALQYEEFFK